MTQAPCYDVVNKQDCPDRKWCLANGRSSCEKWVEYEKKHRAELDAMHKTKMMDQAIHDSNLDRRDRYLKAYTHGKYRIGSK